jgi:hypothetical protein
MKLIARLRRNSFLLEDLVLRMDKLEENIGRLQAASQRGLVSDNLQDYEFRTFSQWGEDGIIQHLLQRIRPEREIFVEFGVQNYVESCTRFLLVNNNWRGLIIDGSSAAIDFIRNDRIYWMHDLTAVHAFITRDNINQLISSNGIQGETGLLTVDIDGNDYWVWEAITCIDPIIVICEYNSLFGPTAKVSIPYKPDFIRTHAHFSNLYFGASLAALTHLGEQKGYALVGSNRHGSNAFFVKADRAAGLRHLTAEEAYVKSKFREALDQNGQSIYTRFEQSLALIRDMPLVDVTTGQSLRVSDLEQMT